jgi:hypothetical protein
MCPRIPQVDTSAGAHKGHHPRLLTLLTDGQKHTLTSVVSNWYFLNRVNHFETGRSAGEACSRLDRPMSSNIS